MVDYEKKALCLKCGLVKNVAKVYKTFYKKYYEIPLNQYDMPLEEAKEIYNNWHDNEDSIDMWNEAEKVNNANYHRVKRLQKRVNKLLTNNCIFLTLTFTDDTLNSTSKQTRRRYITRFLSSVSNAYVGNIDYGKTNKREHYHAIVQCDRVDLSLWKYGNLDAKRILKPNSKALSKYISKLTAHAIKETTQGQRVIYSK